MKAIVSKMNVCFSAFLFLALVAGLAIPAQPVKAAGPVVLVDNLQPSWTAPGGGGVYSAYYGPDNGYVAVSPGSTAVYDGREAGIIQAGLAIDPTDGIYEDEGLFGFMPSVTIDAFAASPLTYDVETAAGVNPVWMTIEVDTGVADDRSDNTTYQFVPTLNPAGWNTVDAGAGQWQKWNDNNGDVTGNPLVLLSDIATENTGLNVVRAYLRLGMGDSYNNGGTGTTAWVDSATLAGVTYDFVVPTFWYVDPTGSDSNEGSLISPFLTIQHAIDSASSGDTIHVAAGTYAENVNVSKSVNLQGAQYDVAVAGRTAADAGESTIQGLVSVNASDVTINGFTLTNPGQTYALTGSSSSSNITLAYNIMDTVGSAALGSNVHAFVFQNGADSVTIAHNRFNNIQAGAKTVSAIGVLDSVSADPSTGFVIQDNTFTNITSSTKGAYGIIFNNAAGVSNAQILDNNFSSLSGGWTHAIGLEGPTSNAIVTGNIFSGLTAAGTDNAAILFQDNPVGDTVTISQNQFNGTAFYGVAVHPDDISSYGYTVVAENNWWDAVSGPGSVASGTGALVGTNVDYSPWCVDSACTTFAPPFETTTTITADSPDASLPGEAVTVNATVEGLPAGAPTPTGTVTVSGADADCTITLSSGAGSCNVTFSAAGSKTLTATYNPDTADFTTSNDTEDHLVSSTPILVTPLDGADLHYNRPTFDWSDFPGATAYQIQISRNNKFTLLVLNKTVSSSTFTFSTNLPANKDLFWRVRSKTGKVWGAWSPIYTFHTANPPSVPNLVSPGNNALVKSSLPLFDWNNSMVPSSATFDHYQIQIATDNAFSNIIHDLDIAGVANSQDNSAVLDPATAYYWRVRSFAADGDYSAWSAVRKLRIAYPAPTLIDPADLSVTGSRAPTFTWSALITGTSYTIQISKNSNFKVLVVYGTVTSPTFTPAHNLAAATTYYWRVRINGPFGPSAWSTPFSFTTP